jgi:hypothetical protein
MQKGVYNYFLNDEPTGITETFEIKLLPDGTKFTKSIRDAKPYNTIITVKVMENENQFRRVEIRHESSSSVHAIYSFQDDKTLFVHEIFSETTTLETLELPNNYVFFPLMRCFQGQTILQVAENADITTVIVPDIQPNTERQNLLKPTFDKRTAKLISTKDNLRLFNYLSIHYDEHSEFHINENGLLVYYKFVQNGQQTWEIRSESSL